MKNLLQQFSKLWSELGINQRISIGLAGVGVLAGMVTLFVWAHRPQMQLLYGRLSEKEASEVLAAVQEQGVAYELGGGGTSIYVPSDEVHKLRLALAAKGIPAGEGVGFEIFDRTNFGISDFVQRTNYVRALQGELGRTIAQVRGVRSARVMVVLPENRLLFSEAKAKPTASVFVDVAGGGLSQEAVNSIRFLVANAVEGLRLDDVAVVDSRGAVLTQNLKDDGALGAASGQMRFRKNLEEYFAGKVETMLATVLGPGNAVVRVSAEVDTASSTTVQEKFDPDGQVAREEKTSEDSTQTNEVAATEGVTGVTSNVPGDSTVASANKPGGKTSEQVRREKTQSYEINRTTINSIKVPGEITHLSAAVFVAAREKPRTAEELQNLRRMVVNALGIKVSDPKELDRLVSLEEVVFEAQPKENAGGGIGETLELNRVLIRDGGAVLIGAIALFLFYRMLKRTKPEGDIVFEVLKPGEQPSAGNVQTGAEISAELLNRMIRQEPASVGATLRDWMNTENGGRN